MAKRFCDNGFASAAIAAPCSSSADIVTADTVIAVHAVAPTPVLDSGATRIAGTNRAPKVGSIIATASDSTGHGASKPA